jgi:predicted transposase/invertase (TIGR01784 family)
MKTDSLFYKLFQQAPSLVFTLAGLELTDADGYQFRSEEIKQTAFRLDGILAPPAEHIDKPLLFVEVQFQTDNAFYSRFFCEIFFYLYQYQPKNPWQAIVIYPSRQVETSGEWHYDALLNSPNVHRLYLEDLVNQPTQQARIRLVQLIIGDKKHTPIAAKAPLKELENGNLIVDNKNQILELIETILIYKFPEFSREEVQKMLGYNDISLKQTRFYQDVYAEGEQKGLQKGMQEGRQEGTQEGEARIILRLLNRRFGTLEQTIQHQIKQLSTAQLESLSEVIFDFSTLDDMTQWLENLPVQSS